MSFFIKSKTGVTPYNKIGHIKEFYEFTNQNLDAAIEVTDALMNGQEMIRIENDEYKKNFKNAFVWRVVDGQKAVKANLYKSLEQCKALIILLDRKDMLPDIDRLLVKI